MVSGHFSDAVVARVFSIANAKRLLYAKQGKHNRRRRPPFHHGFPSTMLVLPITVMTPNEKAGACTSRPLEVFGKNESDTNTELVRKTSRRT